MAFTCNFEAVPSSMEHLNFRHIKVWTLGFIKYCTIPQNAPFFSTFRSRYGSVIASTKLTPASCDHKQLGTLHYADCDVALQNPAQLFTQVIYAFRNLIPPPPPPLSFAVVFLGASWSFNGVSWREAPQFILDIYTSNS